MILFNFSAHESAVYVSIIKPANPLISVFVRGSWVWVPTFQDLGWCVCVLRIPLYCDGNLMERKYLFSPKKYVMLLNAQGEMGSILVLGIDILELPKKKMRKILALMAPEQGPKSNNP